MSMCLKYNTHGPNTIVIKKNEKTKQIISEYKHRRHNNNC